MKTKTIQTWILVTAAFITGCTMPVALTEMAALVVVNDLSRTFRVQAELNSHKFEPEVVAPNQEAFILLYEQSGKKDALPQSLTGLVILLPGCRINLDALDVLRLSIPSENGRPGRNLRIGETTLAGLDCS